MYCDVEQWPDGWAAQSKTPTAPGRQRPEPRPAGEQPEAARESPEARK
jgi:hypothetical protein